MKDKLWWWLVPVVVLCGVAAGFYFTHRTHDSAEITAAPAVQTGAAETPAIQHPVPTVTADEPLPGLDDSDPSLLQAMGRLLGEASVQQLFVPTQLVRHIVATIDNLPRKKVAPQALPVKPLAGAFAAKEADGVITLAPQNAARYSQWVKVVESVDAQQFSTLYFRYYPLFQEAYRNLGYPNGYFNDRLVEVIDDALATPDISGPIELVQPGVVYQYANPDLEARSAGQKVLLRIGNENAAKVKRKLREVRAAITQEKSGG